LLNYNNTKENRRISRLYIEGFNLNRVQVQEMAIAAFCALERRTAMTGFNPVDFGRAFEKIQMEYQTGIGTYLAPFLHIMAILVLCHVLLNKKKNPKLFII
jgi:hypothetical protein